MAILNMLMNVFRNKLVSLYIKKYCRIIIFELFVFLLKIFKNWRNIFTTKELYAILVV